MSVRFDHDMKCGCEDCRTFFSELAFLWSEYEEAAGDDRDELGYMIEVGLEICRRKAA